MGELANLRGTLEALHGQSQAINDQLYKQNEHLYASHDAILLAHTAMEMSYMQQRQAYDTLGADEFAAYLEPAAALHNASDHFHMDLTAVSYGSEHEYLTQARSHSAIRNHRLAIAQNHILLVQKTLEAGERRTNYQYDSVLGSIAIAKTSQSQAIASGHTTTDQIQRYLDIL